MTFVHLLVRSYMLLLLISLLRMVFERDLENQNEFLIQLSFLLQSKFLVDLILFDQTSDDN